MCLVKLQDVYVLLNVCYIGLLATTRGRKQRGPKAPGLCPSGGSGVSYLPSSPGVFHIVLGISA